MAKSNTQGRALEYCFVKVLEKFCLDKNIQFSASQRSLTANMRDEEHFNNIPSDLKEDFMAFSNKALFWLEQNSPLVNVLKLSLDRLSDAAGIGGDVTDIHLEAAYANSSKKEICLSIKHNHDALKHPRISKIPESWCAVIDKDVLFDYLKNIDAIWDGFIKAAKSLINNPTTFEELKQADSAFINTYLYIPLNNYVISFLKANAVTPDKVAGFFKFITGTDHDFYVIKNEENQIVVKKFIGIVPPAGFEISIIRPTTFLIKFNNGWNISLRLHTASKRLFRKNGSLNKSIKYDVLCQNLAAVIDTEAISKTN